MKKVITLTIVVVSLLSMGCNSLKRQINPNEEKIGVEGEDYTLSYHKLKKGYAEILKINVIEYGDPIPSDRWYLWVNGVSIFRPKENYLRLSPNRKYDMWVTGVRAGKSVYIKKIKVKENDSIMLTVYLKDTLMTID
jgi:hypothetical protein|nr:hypothetical protein [uncultured Capnocytophaga sp.]